MSNNGNGKVKGVSSPPNYLHNYRCRTCGRLLFRAILPPGAVIEIRCTKSSCHTMTILDMQPFQPVLQLDDSTCNIAESVLE